MKYDFVIIGSGISSLTSALLLLKKGFSVCILEQYRKLGGYMHCFNRFGSQFDTGAHYIGAMNPGEPFHALLNYLDVYDETIFSSLDPSGFDVFNFPSFEARFLNSHEETIDHLSGIFPQESDGIRRYFDLVKTVARNFPTYEFRDSYDTGMLKEYLETSLWTVVNQVTQNKKLQCLFYAYSDLHGVHPKDVSFGFHAIVTDSLLRSAHGFSEGGDALTDKFVEKIKSLGGEIRSNHKVVELKASGKEVTEVVVEKRRGADSERINISAEKIISGAHPKVTFGLVEPLNLKPVFKERLSNLKESIGIFGVYAGCSEPPPFEKNRNYYYFNTEDPETLLEENDFDSDPCSVFLSCPNRTAGAGKFHPLTIHAPSPYEWFSEWENTEYGRRPQDYTDKKNKYADRVLTFLDARCEGLLKTVEKYEASTPLSNLHYNMSNEGSAYGVYHSFDNTGPRAMGPRTHYQNLFLTGQNTLFPGLFAAATSGIRTVGSITGIKPYLRELQDIQRSFS